ncbi:hypothetical protein GCM10007881_01510 [Mesorhizobium huakuii]|nr:hypothetical protein GCM10007881_01510 [Mesorhizobium huakuii]
MPNHVHLILTPTDPDGLRRALAKVHRAYAGIIHARQKKTGHFWQGRFGAVAMDDDHVLSAVSYVGLNPARAGLVKQAADWPWSSARAHLTGSPMALRIRSQCGTVRHHRAGCSIWQRLMPLPSTLYARPRASADRWATRRLLAGLPRKPEEL